MMFATHSVFPIKVVLPMAGMGFDIVILYLPRRRFPVESGISILQYVTMSIERAADAPKCKSICG